MNLAFEHGRPANDAARVLVRSLECAAAERLGLAPRFALVACGAPTVRATRALSERLKAPGDCRDLALLARQHGETIKHAPTLGAPDLLALLEHCDALRRSERFDELLAVLACVERGERGWTESPYMPRVVLRRALAAAAGVERDRTSGAKRLQRTAQVCVGDALATRGLSACSARAKRQAHCVATPMPSLIRAISLSSSVSENLRLRML